MTQGIFVVLFKDGSIMPLLDRPNRADMQIGARLFDAKTEMDLAQLSYWIGKGHPNIPENIFETHFKGERKP